MFAKILVAVDGSEVSSRVLDAAIAMAQKFDAQVSLLHVVREMQLPKNLGLMQEYEAVNRQRHDLLNSVGEQIINQATRTTESKGVSVAGSDIGTGDPATAIIKQADKVGADLIIIGSRGLGEVEGMLLGSVSRKVSNTAKVPCLIIK
ncbi:MAG: universal stress protein [Pseudomonadota bacterium]